MNLIDRIDSLIALVSAGTEILKNGGHSRAVIASLNEQLLALREELNAAKHEALAAHNENQDLRRALLEADRFAQERENYTLVRFPGAGAVYLHQRDLGQPHETAIYYCVSCFQHRKHSVLQFAQGALHHDRFDCQACGAQVLVPRAGPPAMPETTGDGGAF